MADSPAGWFPVLTTIIGFAASCRDRNSTDAMDRAGFGPSRSGLTFGKAPYTSYALCQLRLLMTPLAR